MTAVRALMAVVKEAGRGRRVTRQMVRRIALEHGVDPAYFRGVA
jgi:hypothetical protein